MHEKQRQIFVSAAIACIGILALVIRWWAAIKAYPCSGDAGHFVQYGVALAHGVPGSLSTYWSQMMIIFAYLAETLGMDPRYAMQYVSMVSGTIVVIVSALIAWRVTRHTVMMLITAGLCAVNPVLVQHSVTGYSEMPYLACMLLGVYVGIKQDRHPIMRAILAGSLIGVAGYFKGLDAAVAAVSMGLYLFIARKNSLPVGFAHASVISVTAFIVLLPLCIYTYQQSGKFMPGSKGGNLALGLDWKDSKIVYAADPELAKKKTKSTSEIIRMLPVRIARNIPDIYRIFNKQLFIKGFRMGTIWFGLICILWLYHVFRFERSLMWLPLCMLIFQLMLLSLVFVHSRLLVPSLIWIIFIVGAFLKIIWGRCDVFRRYVMGVLIGVFMVVNAVYSFSAYQMEFCFWRYPHIIATAEKLKNIAKDDDVIMTYGPHVAVEFYEHNPRLTVEMPYGTLEEVEAIAQKHGVQYIIVSDTFRSHWPISQVFEASSELPENWKIVETLRFDGDPAGYRYPSEQIMILRRTSDKS